MPNSCLSSQTKRWLLQRSSVISQSHLRVQQISGTVKCAWRIIENCYRVIGSAETFKGLASERIGAIG